MSFMSDSRGRTVGWRPGLILVSLASLAAALALCLLPAAASAYYSGKYWPGDPLAGHPWFVDKSRGSWFVTAREDPRQYGGLMNAGDNPMGKTFGSFIPNPGTQVRDYIARADSEEPGSIPFINLGRIEEGCPQNVAPAGFTESEIDDWVKNFSDGIGNGVLMVIVETDKLATIGCGTRAGIARHYRELDYEVSLLHKHNPNAIVYVDAGASNWGHTPAVTAGRLRKADVKLARGFVLGASHYDWTSDEVSYGLKISKRLGGVHFVVNTSQNGWGPTPRRGHYSAFYHPGCIPTGEGLGYIPTTKTPNAMIDAYVWAGTPGYEEGNCLGYGQGSPYKFYPALALSLEQNANPKLPK
jgi:endoglucanase